MAEPREQQQTHATEAGQQPETRRLTERQVTVLRYIVQEYVGGGRAVGSHTLIDRYPLNVSSATVRNEMAALERLGLIQQLHTSAGRVPTDRGYRYYVEQFASDSALPANEQIMIRHQFRQVESQLETWLELAAAVLAEFAHNVSVITAPRSAVARLRHFELLSLQERAALLILVTQESTVRQAMLHLREPATQDQLSGCADRLNAILSDKDASEMEALAGELTGVDREIALHVMSALEATQTSERADIRYHGLEHALQQPEFSDTDVAQRLFDLLRGGALLNALLPQVTFRGGPQVFIGDENLSEDLRPFGVVVATYGVDNAVTGLLGILGPRRMPYERSISSVRYMAALMSDLMRDLYRA
jgi:heat-inducible transcriptional repressor